MAAPDGAASADSNNKSGGMSKLFDEVLFLAINFEPSRLDKCVLKMPKEEFKSRYIHFALIVILNLIDLSALHYLQGLCFLLFFSVLSFDSWENGSWPDKLVIQ